MPLDAGDVEKITQIIERATNRIEMDIRQLMPRSEYEQRHVDLHNRTIKNEQSIQEIMRWAMAEHEKIAARSDARFNELKADVKEVGSQVDEIKSDISAGRVTTIRYIATVVISILVGIAIPLLLRVLGV